MIDVKKTARSLINGDPSARKGWVIQDVVVTNHGGGDARNVRIYGSFCDVAFQEDDVTGVFNVPPFGTQKPLLKAGDSIHAVVAQKSKDLVRSELVIAYNPLPRVSFIKRVLSFRLISMPVDSMLSSGQIDYDETGIPRWFRRWRRLGQYSLRERGHRSVNDVGQLYYDIELRDET